MFLGGVTLENRFWFIHTGMFHSTSRLPKGWNLPIALAKTLESTNHPPTPKKLKKFGLGSGAPPTEDAIVACYRFHHRNFPTKKYHKKKCNCVILVVTTQHLGCGGKALCWWDQPLKVFDMFCFWSMKGFKVDIEFDIPRKFNIDRYPKWWCLKSIIPPQVWPLWSYIYIYIYKLNFRQILICRALFHLHVRWNILLLPLKKSKLRGWFGHFIRPRRCCFTVSWGFTYLSEFHSGLPGCPVTRGSLKLFIFSWKFNPTLTFTESTFLQCRKAGPKTSISWYP